MASKKTRRTFPVVEDRNFTAHNHTTGEILQCADLITLLQRVAESWEMYDRGITDSMPAWTIQ